MSQEWAKKRLGGLLIVVFGLGFFCLTIPVTNLITETQNAQVLNLLLGVFLIFMIAYGLVFAVIGVLLLIPKNKRDKAENKLNQLFAR